MGKSTNYPRYFWTATYVIVGIVIGSAFVSLFCHTHAFNAFSLLLWSFGYLVMGGLVGFIFSVPKIISEASPIVGPQQAARENNRVEENTNLTQISDWLTKILIGAGLVEIKEAPRFVLNVGKLMAQGH